MLPRRGQAEETFAAFRMSCLRSFGIVLALQVAAAWATGVTPAPGAAAAAPAAAAAVNGTPQHGAAVSATPAAAAAVAGHGQVNTAPQNTHKCTNVKLFSECRVHCEYVVEGKGAYFIFTDGQEGVPCKTRTLDGQVLSGACHQGLCTVKDQAGAAPPGADGAAAGAATPAAAAAAAATPGAAHPAAAAAATPAHAAAAAAASAKHKKA